MPYTMGFEALREGFRKSNKWKILEWIKNISDCILKSNFSFSLENE
jgi:hypothetical protein